jgi:hypothetical protein
MRGDQKTLFSLRQFLHSLPWNSILRRVPGLLLLCLVPWSVYGPLYFPWAFGFYFLFLHILFFANNIRTAYGVFVTYTESVTTSCTNWLQKYTKETGTSNGSDLRHDLPFDSISHIIILPNYKETMETLCETLDVLASHQRALTQYRVSVFFPKKNFFFKKKS